MKLTTLVLGVTVILRSGVAVAAQETPTDIPKAELPKKAICVVCESSGGGHGEEKPAAGVRYKGKSYYFCASGEVAEFKKEPESFMPPVLPRPAPALELKSLEGRAASLEEFKGKIVLVDFWATWCKPCVKAMPDLMKLHSKFADKGFTVVGISLDEEGAKAVRPFVEKRKINYPILLDESKAWKLWGVRAIPAMFLIDKDGKIVRQWVGTADKKELERAIESLVGASKP